MQSGMKIFRLPEYFNIRVFNNYHILLGVFFSRKIANALQNGYFEHSSELPEET